MQVLELHACTRALVRACTRALVLAFTRALVHACTRIQVHACTGALVHACTRARAHACTRALVLIQSGPVRATFLFPVQVVGTGPGLIFSVQSGLVRV